MTGSKLIVHLFNSFGETDSTVLLVHVVGSRPGVVSDPDTVVLDDARVLLEHFGDGNELSVGAFYTAKLAHKVPEL